MNHSETVIYKEVQKFRQWWFIVLVLLVIIPCWYGAIQQLIFKNPFGDNPASDPVMFGIWIVFGILFPVFLLSLKMETTIKTDGIYVMFFPFHRKPQRFPYSSIQSYLSVTYRPIRDYGGWGIRWGRDGKAYNVSGNRGLQLEFVDGKRLLIGSQKPEELEKAIRNISS
jgi:hypothetical protein